MSLKRSAANVLVWLAALAAGLALTNLLAQTSTKKILFVFLFLIALAVFAVLRPYLSTEQIMMPILYLLISATFANNAFFTIKLGFFSLFPYRILLILAGFWFVMDILKGRGHLEKWKQVHVKGILSFFAFWFCYGMISLLWVKSVTDGVKYLSLLAMGMFFVFLIVLYFQKLDRLLAFYYIWMTLTIFLMVIGFYNHFTLHHLPSSTLFNGPHYKQHYPTSVFFNQNDFATFLSISFFFYLAFFKNIKNSYLKTAGLILAFCSVYLIFLTGSRASILGVIAGLALYVFILLPRILKKWALIIAAAGFIAFAALFAGKITDKFYEYFLAPQASHDFSEPLPSNVARANLLKNAGHYVLDTYGFGVGAGNVPYYLEHHALFDTDQVVEVHNWLVEIMANFGVLMMLGYFTMYLYVMLVLYRFYKKGLSSRYKLLIEGLLAALVSFLVSSISPSSVSNLYFHWVFLALVLAAVNTFRIHGTSETERFR
ncbi:MULTISPECIES: teichuronic acid biosynthesis protein TuaE [unclassified Bacillus (in: firmicutes)]|uniref:teichuronic acid biosynthesis protein TuaE n=1 Tax=unclassified Bacillus (in: firmicutes) TaxID=185979 RepID=UPI0004072F4E|nr:MULTISPECIES: O-antigen ligase family protein [unclassified Bacillus (in: firmicutes)]QHZ45410.1 O-antigen ligase family protein [Bacillus sp. NSP9.1]WFA04790.1 O-antigen ligase family protein [Bacillus sp. HSf4]